ncbi:hypothetical protein FAF44_33075 [Nonomuraea sp. MG754425]|uniref:hypothetical protein n=1 Tax=Nonomuraea sp. MG754425 TaxID=2570319 RepID=UPI001F26B58A|nr:hypothetical protein [Nonomuraea sp. MG754425]MCF6473186.1 hypothetical protein [Nonomuraea sp. MG754425]
MVAYGATRGIDVRTLERNPAGAGFVPLPKRWVVEQIYGTMSLHGRLVRDDEQDPAVSLTNVLSVPGCGLWNESRALDPRLIAGQRSCHAQGHF